MATTTVRPNGTTATGSGLTVVGAASHHVAQSDDSDGTYSQWDAASNPSLIMEFGTLVLPVNAQVRRVTPRVRLATAAAGVRAVSYRPQIAALSWFGPLSVASPSTVLSTYTGGAATSGPVGVFRQSDIDALQLLVFPQTTGAVPAVRGFEAYLDVEYNEAPVASSVTPAGNVGTAQPVVEFSYADPEGDVKERHRVKVFTAAQVAAVGFDAETSEAVFDSGDVLSNALTQPVSDVFLDSGVVHRAFVKVGDFTPTGYPARYGPWLQGPEFTPIDTAAETPPAPVVSVFPSTNRVELELTWDVTDLDEPKLDIQRSTDGLTWWWLRGGRQWVPPGVSPQTFTDYEAPRDVPLRYRVRLTGLRAGLPASSLWSPPSAVMTLLADGNAWLKSPTDPTLNMTIIHATRAFESHADEDVVAFWPEGRRTPIVVSGTIHSEEVKELELFFRNDDAWRRFEMLRGRQEPLLLQTCYGDQEMEQFWLRLGPTRKLSRLTHDGMNTSQFRRVSIAAWEVSPPNEVIYGVPGETPFVLDESVLS